MIRSLYAALIRMHPPAFQRRFGGEMLSIFDQTPGTGRSSLVGDAVFSFLRQWLLRPEFREPETPVRERIAGVPMFRVLDDDPRLTQGQWMGGAALSLLAFASVSILIAHGGNYSMRLIGSRHTSQFGVRVHGATAGSLDTEVKVSSPDILEIDAVRRLVAGYFDDVPVMSALDLNHDLTISADEIANAPESLLTLDENGDGALDATECGKVFAGDFMRLNPVLAALDANRDGVISAKEIRNAARALGGLDRNQDGRLTVDEFLPGPLLKQLRIILQKDGNDAQ